VPVDDAVDNGGQRLWMAGLWTDRPVRRPDTHSLSRPLNRW